MEPPHHPLDRLALELELVSRRRAAVAFDREGIERLAGMGARDPAAALCALALLEPSLRVLARRLARRGLPLSDAETLVVSAAWESLREGTWNAGVGGVVADTWRRVRRELRRDRPLAETPEGRAATAGAEPRPPVPLEDPPGLLAEACRAGVITGTEARLVALTRLGGWSIAALARSTDSDPRALYRTRQRAEAALRRYARRPYDDSEA